MWVRGRRVGGAKSFLDKGGRTSIVVIQEQKYYALLGPPKRTGNEKKWGIRPGGSLEHGEESLLEPSNAPVHPLELPLNRFLTGVGQLSYPTCIWVSYAWKGKISDATSGVPWPDSDTFR